MKILLIRKLSKCGDKFVFTVPKEFLEKGLLKHGEVYKLEIEEVRKHG